MKLTNRMGLPQPIFDAVKNDSYSRGDANISVTELIAPPRQVVLKRRHADEIVEDASDRIWSLLGQSIHTALERANVTGIAERRLSIEVEGWRVSGGMDLYDEDGILVDYKVTSVRSVREGAKDDWVNQLNVYAEILRANGHAVRGLRVVAILRDWSKGQAKRDADYPDSQVMKIEIPLWPNEKAEKYVRERVILHRQARVELPLCTALDRWAKPDTFAVFKQGGKRATRVYESDDEACSHASQNSSLYVVKRPGASTRCDDYCSAAKFCTQYRAIQESKVEAEAETV